MTKQNSVPDGDSEQPGSVDVDPHTSHAQTRERFRTPDAAAHYPNEIGRSFRAQREWNSLKKCFQGIPAGSDVLDLPCGSGRFVPLLLEQGYRVTAADYSPHMIEKARNFIESKFGNQAPIKFEVRDVLQTNYPTAHFDAVMSHRLFHHFNEPDIRVAALRELRRISRSRVIVSFFNSFALDAAKFKLKHLWRGTQPVDRIPIPLSTFQTEIATAGLEIAEQHPVLWGLSPLWCLVLKPDAASQTSTSAVA